MSFDLEAARRCYEKNQQTPEPPASENDYKKVFLDAVRHNVDAISYCFQDRFIPSGRPRREATIAAMRTLWESDYYVDLGLERRGDTVRTSTEVVPAQREALHAVYDQIFQIDPDMAHREVARVNILGVVALVVVGVGAYAFRRSTVGLIACAGMGLAHILGLIILNGITSSHRNAVDTMIKEAVGVTPGESEAVESSVDGGVQDWAGWAEAGPDGGVLDTVISPDGWSP